MRSCSGPPDRNFERQAGRRPRARMVQLHNSLAVGKPPQAGMDDVLAPAPPPDADAAADPDPPLDPVRPPPDPLSDP